jgi:hypothetical protein
MTTPPIHQAGLQVATDQAQYRLVFDSSREPFHQDVVINPVKEFLQIDIDHHPVSVLHVTLCLQHRVLRSAARPEAVTRFREGRINLRLQDLQQGLLDQSIRDRRDTQFALATAGLWDLNASHRLGPVAAIQDRFPYRWPVRL